jgi:hypothetical protein
MAHSVTEKRSYGKKGRKTYRFFRNKLSGKPCEESGCMPVQ